MSYFKQIIHFISAYILGLAWAGLILYATVLSTPKVNPDSWLRLIPFIDKWVHMGLFFILAALLLIEVQGLKFKMRPTGHFLIVGLSTLYGAAIEVLQALCTSNRHAEWLDLLADAAGAVLAWIFLSFFFNKILKNKT